MTYLEYLEPGLHYTGYAFLLLLICVFGVTGILSLIAIFTGEEVRFEIPRFLFVIPILVSAAVLIFGIPFALWLHEEWWPSEPEPVYHEKTVSEEFAACMDRGGYWYQGKEEPTYWICSKELIENEDLQRFP